MHIQELIKIFFQNKTKQLLAVSNQAVAEHSSLKGSHRESIVEIYLKEILPKRFGISKGMVYGLINQSKEADIIIWDEQNYPELKLYGHSLFFAESAKGILEIKTNWSIKEFNDIKRKAYSAKHIFKNYKPNVRDDIRFMQNQIFALQNKTQFGGTLSAPYHILFTAFIFWGGENFTIKNLKEKDLDEIDDYWPDLMVFLNAGKILVKEYIENDDDSMRGKNIIRLYNTKDETLLFFTSFLLGEIMERSVSTEYPFYFTDYISNLFRDIEFEEKEYFSLRAIPGGFKNFFQ